MDWQAVEDGLRAWVIAATGVAAHLVAWDRAPVGLRFYPQYDLRLFDHRARDGMTPAVVYPEADGGEQLQPMVVAERACSWSITCTTRDQRANGKAYVSLDELAVLLEAPYSVERLGALGLVVLDLGRVIPNSDVPDAHRDLSQATLTLQLGYVTTVSLPDGVEGALLETIEHVEVGGEAIDVVIPVDIPPEIIPPL